MRYLVVIELAKNRGFEAGSELDPATVALCRVVTQYEARGRRGGVKACANVMSVNSHHDPFRREVLKVRHRVRSRK